MDKKNKILTYILNNLANLRFQMTNSVPSIQRYWEAHELEINKTLQYGSIFTINQKKIRKKQGKRIKDN